MSARSVLPVLLAAALIAPASAGVLQRLDPVRDWTVCWWDINDPNAIDEFDIDILAVESNHYYYGTSVQWEGWEEWSYIQFYMTGAPPMDEWTRASLVAWTTPWTARECGYPYDVRYIRINDANGNGSYGDVIRLPWAGKYDAPFWAPGGGGAWDTGWTVWNVTDLLGSALDDSGQTLTFKFWVEGFTTDLEDYYPWFTIASLEGYGPRRPYLMFETAAPGQSVSSLGAPMQQAPGLPASALIGAGALLSVARRALSRTSRRPCERRGMAPP